MTDYFSLVTLTPPLDPDAVQRLARLACLELYRAQWRRAFLANDGTRMLGWYRAPDAETVRLILRQQGTASAVWTADASASDEGDPACPPDPDCVLVEFGVDASLGAGEVAANRAATVASIEAAQLRIRRKFVVQSGARMLCVIDHADEAVVSKRLRAAGLIPSEVWRCTEIDPEPRRLFRPHAPAVAGPPVPPHAPRCGEPRREDPRPLMAQAITDFDAVIIGAGLSGICALERFVRMGLRVRAYEQGSDVGGVWYWNRYPGARVDSETYTYGFSFSDALVREWDWHELFAPQAEIASYLRHVVDRFDLRRHVHFETRVTAASYDERYQHWSIVTDTGERVSARYLIIAAGTLSAPQMPDYPGIEQFRGEIYHTARWPAAGVALNEKRVGVIGTGATGVQVIQTIAGQVDRLTVFQRTPTYCIPQRNRRLTDTEREQIRRDWQGILEACSESYGGFIHTFDPRPGLAISAEEREAKFETLWQVPGFAFWFGNFGDLMMNPEVNAHACEFVRRKIRERVHDPEVARRLLPNHPFGTKRVPLENGYYETYNRPNVRLVDLREEPIVRVTDTGIRTSREDHPLDVIICATGFDAGTGALIRIDIRGENALALADKWREGPRTYLGLLVSGFPNLFIVNGPHNAAALCNAGRCVEQNVDWIARCIERMRASGHTRVAASVAAEDEWTRHVYQTADASVLALMTNSWFFGANTPGKPRRATIYAAGAREYREHCEDVARAGYPGLNMM
jgi:cation diffusion facilitator CzcD-associated flavoprotein CzcO